MKIRNVFQTKGNLSFLTKSLISWKFNFTTSFWKKIKVEKYNLGIEGKKSENWGLDTLKY